MMMMAMILVKIMLMQMELKSCDGDLQGVLKNYPLLRNARSRLLGLAVGRLWTSDDDGGDDDDNGDGDCEHLPRLASPPGTITWCQQCIQSR